MLGLPAGLFQAAPRAVASSNSIECAVRFLFGFYTARGSCAAERAGFE